MVEHAGWVFVQRFLVPSILVDVRHFSFGPEANLHSQQSNEDANCKI